MKPRAYYHRLRADYTPANLRTIFLFESPPVSGKYFYDPSGKTTEPLFSAIMRLFGWAPSAKAEGLALFRDAGYVLVDATYRQVNGMTKTERRRIMREDYGSLVQDLRTFGDVEIIVGMVGVLDAVGERLVTDGFRVINNGRRIPFPSNGQQRRFHEMALEVLAEREMAG